MLFKDQKQGDPFGPKGQEQKQEDEDFSPPKVGEFLQKSKQLLNEARTPMYCNLCGLDVLACQHYNGVHEGNTVNALKNRPVVGQDRLRLLQEKERQCGCMG